MKFENNLSEPASQRAQLASHLPLVLIVLGFGATFIALHVAVAGLLALAVLHLVAGLGLLAFRRHRAAGGAE